MPTKPTRLLIVDDDVRICTLLSAILAQSGYWVRTAKDGFSALAEIRNQIPDILLSDLNMPGMSGFELLSVVRRTLPSIQAIAMSSMFSGDTVPAGIAAAAFYEKGSNVRSLLQILEAMTEPERIGVRQRPISSDPIWIPMNGHNPFGDAYVIISCPECLRTFPQVLDETVRTTHETDCVHCGRMIHYAIVQPPEPMSPQTFPRKSATGMNKPVSIPIRPSDVQVS